MARREPRIRLSRRTRRRRRLLLVLLLVTAAAVGGWFFFSGGDKAPQPAVSTAASRPDGWARGVLFDSRRKRLAETIEQVSVYVRTREVDSISATAAQLATTLSLDRTELERKLKRGSLRVWISRQISQQQEEAIESLGLPGVYMKREWRRSYPNGAMAAHLLGFSENGVGLAGVEYRYDRLLARHKEDSRTRRDLLLSLDLKLQKPLEEILTTLRENAVSRGVEMRVSGCIIDAASGEIVAFGQLPGFDPNDFARYDPRILASMMFEPILLPAAFRVLLRDAAMFYRPDTRVAEYGGWPMVPEVETGRQLQLFTALNLDRRIYADFYSGSREQSPVEGRLIQSSQQRGLQMIPEVSTPMTLLFGLTTLLHGLPAAEPSVISRITSDRGEDDVELKKVAPEGSSPKLNQNGVDRLFQAMATRGSALVSLEGEASGTVPESGSGDVFVRNRVIFADIPSGGGALTLLVATEVRGCTPFLLRSSGETKPLDISGLLNDKLGRVGILHMVAAGAADLLPSEKGKGHNWQHKSEKKRAVAAKPKKNRGPVTMPDLHGLSLRKSMRLLDGVPVKLVIEGSGRVVRQSPKPGTPLKKGGLCRLVLERKEVELFHEKRE